MINIKRFLFTAILANVVLVSGTVFAGNPDRAGHANVTGIEAMRLNVAGLSATENTEISFNKDVWLQLKGSNLGVSNIGFAQKMGKNGGVLGINLLGMSFGDIPITTTGVPDVVNGQATLGTYAPHYYNLSLCYAKKVSQSIQGGVGVTAISEQIPNAKAQGFALDAGIQYTPVAEPQIHIIFRHITK